jgi:hypothetical protein
MLGFRSVLEAPVMLGGLAYWAHVLDMGPASVDGWLTRIIATELRVEDDSILDIAQHQLVLDERRVALTRLEFEVFKYLYERPGAVVERAELLRDVWGYRLRRRQQRHRGPGEVAAAQAGRPRRGDRDGSRRRLPVRSRGGLGAGPHGGPIALGDLALVGRERTQDHVLLGLRDVEAVERPGQLGRDLVELFGRDLQVAMGVLEAQDVVARPDRRVLERPAGDVADPERPHELQAGQPAQVVGGPLASCGFCDFWPTIGFWISASLNWSTTAAIANTPPSRS